MGVSARRHSTHTHTHTQVSSLRGAAEKTELRFAELQSKLEHRAGNWWLARDTMFGDADSSTQQELSYAAVSHELAQKELMLYDAQRELLSAREKEEACTRMHTRTLACTHARMRNFTGAHAANLAAPGMEGALIGTACRAAKDGE